MVSNEPAHQPRLLVQLLLPAMRFSISQSDDEKVEGEESSTKTSSMSTR